MTKERSQSRRNANPARKSGVKPKQAGLLRGAARKEAAAAVAGHIGGTQTLAEFLATTSPLTETERAELVDQALVMIEQIYVHLGLKRAMHAIDPVQRLKLLRQRLAAYDDREFHDEMIAIYTHLRDLHTNYILPNPYQSRIAALPFRIEEFTESGKRQYVVTQVSPSVTDSKFRPGVIPTHWNGVPIDRAVEINAEREAGSNLAARHAQGLEHLTNRWMGMSLPPDEEWVIVGYLDGDTPRETKFDWQVFEPGAPESGVDPISATGEIAKRLGIDAKAEIQRRVRKLLFAPDSIVSERRAAARRASGREGAAPLGAGETAFPDAFKDFRDVTTPHGTFAYVRLTSFNVVDDEAFVQEFIRIVRDLSQKGLILDVRGNGGGNIWAGERLLQLLTPGRIQPELFSFVTSKLALQLCESDPSLKQWVPSIAQSTEIGTAYSQGYELTPADKCNSIGQKYQGPVVLITDAQCYSTTDIFAAGFQDHGIGTILGTSARTGAGGANVWTHDNLRELLSDPTSPFHPLTQNASFRVALRRALRVGPNAGVILEDLGVTPNENHAMTKNDVLNGNVDLINHAAELLAARAVSRLTLSLGPAVAGSNARTMNANMDNIDRLDVFVDGRPRLTLDVTDGTAKFDVPLPKSPFLIEAQGYNSDAIVAASRIPSEAMVA
jgi:C-terminal processing protease CtpA/Prc